MVVPPNPLTAKGLSTPYQFKALNPANGPCNMGNTLQVSFVQGAVLDPATGKISVYNPLATDAGVAPLIPPVVPVLPAGAVVALWFGSNAGSLTLIDNNGSLAQGNCTNGLPGSIFGQFSYCNAVNFFIAANAAIKKNQLIVPALGMALDGMPCPTVRSFDIVDQDQSDNVLTTYLVLNGQTAQDTTANANALADSIVEANGSDNRLVDIAIDSVIGCTPWLVPDLADPQNTVGVSALPLNELLAAATQLAPIALVPLGDPMCLNNGATSLAKTNLYRAGVNQPPATAVTGSTLTYCMDFLSFGPSKLVTDRSFFIKSASPGDPNSANLYGFLMNRMSNSLGPNGLNCLALLNIQNPVTVIFNGMIAIDGTINFQIIQSVVTVASIPQTAYSGFPSIASYPVGPSAVADASSLLVQLSFVLLAFIIAL